MQASAEGQGGRRIPSGPPGSNQAQECTQHLKPSGLPSLFSVHKAKFPATNHSPALAIPYTKFFKKACYGMHGFPKRLFAEYLQTDLDHPGEVPHILMYVSARDNTLVDRFKRKVAFMTRAAQVRVETLAHFSWLLQRPQPSQVAY